MTADVPYSVYADLIGVPFVRGGRSLHAGFDCYGAVMEMYKRVHLRIIPDFASPGTKESIEDLMDRERKTWRKVNPQPGAVLLFRVEGYRAHVGFQVTQEDFVHAIDPAGFCRQRLSTFAKPVAAYVYG